MSGSGSDARAAAERRAISLILGAAPAAAISTRLVDGIVLSAATFLVLAGMSFLLPLVRRGMPGEAGAGSGRAAEWGALLLSSSLTAVVELALNALMPAESAHLGIYVPLIAVSMLTMGRVDDLAHCPSPRRAVLPTLRLGAAFAAILIAVALGREILGAGTITLGGTTTVAFLADDPARAFGLAGGALICLGYVAAVLRLAFGLPTRGGAGQGGEQ